MYDYVLWLLSMFFLMLCFFVLMRLIINFENKFDLYIANAVSRGTLFCDNFNTLHDTVLAVSAVCKPAYARIFNKYIVNAHAPIQEEIRSVPNTSICVGDDCCCDCQYRTTLTTATSSSQEEDIFDIGYACVASVYSDARVSYINTAHGHCKDFTKKIA